MANVTTVTDSAPARDDGRRSALLEQAADYVMERGLADLSLRPLADALATSARMLMYYFGSKERLIVEALQLIAQRERAELTSKASDGGPLRAYWRWVSDEERRRYLRLLYEVYGLALRDPGYYGSFLADEALDWLRFAEHGFREAGLSDTDSRALSTYTLATMRGLELDLLTTKEIDRANAAFELFHADLERRLASLADGLNRQRDATQQRRPNMTTTEAPPTTVEQAGIGPPEIERQPATASALPPRYYTDPAIYKLEEERIFRKQWMFVGREDEVAQPGDYITIDIAGTPLIIVRDQQGTVRALSGSCLHRYMPVAEGAGNRSSFQCPYHLWTYGLDGQLIGAPEMEHATVFDKSACRLPEARLEVWEGFIFVNLDPEAEPLSPQLETLSRRLAGYHLGEMRTAALVDYEL